MRSNAGQQLSQMSQFPYNEQKAANLQAIKKLAKPAFYLNINNLKFIQQ